MQNTDLTRKRLLGYMQQFRWQADLQIGCLEPTHLIYYTCGHLKHQILKLVGKVIVQISKQAAIYSVFCVTLTVNLSVFLLIFKAN